MILHEIKCYYSGNWLAIVRSAFFKTHTQMEMLKMSLYLFFDVFEWGWWDYWEADEEDVCLWVGEWPQPVVVLLTGSVKKTQCVRLAPNHHRHRVVVENLPNVKNIILIIFIVWRLIQHNTPAEHKFHLVVFTELTISSNWRSECVCEHVVASNLLDQSWQIILWWTESVLGIQHN